LRELVPPRKGEVIPGVQDLLEERGKLFFVKGREAAQQDIEDDAYRPHVHCARLVPPVLEYLGRDVARRAANRLHHVSLAHHARQPDVRNLDCLPLAQEVLRLEIAMDDLPRVEVAERIAQRLDGSGGVRLCVGALGLARSKEGQFCHNARVSVTELTTIWSNNSPP